MVRGISWKTHGINCCRRDSESVMASRPLGMIFDLWNSMAPSNNPGQVWKGNERHDVLLAYDDRLEWWAFWLMLVIGVALYPKRWHVRLIMNNILVCVVYLFVNFKFFWSHLAHDIPRLARYASNPSSYRCHPHMEIFGRYPWSHIFLVNRRRAQSNKTRHNPVLQKTIYIYNSRDSLVAIHPTTNRPACGFSAVNMDLECLYPGKTRARLRKHRLHITHRSHQ